jgi:dTDP-D-glucose 4,6-dehydratase
MQNMKELIQNDNFTFLKEDIRNFEKIDEIIKKYNITHISHQAAR